MLIANIWSPETVCHGPHNHPKISSLTQVENFHTQINEVNRSTGREYHLEENQYIINNVFNLKVYMIFKKTLHISFRYLRRLSDK